MALVADSKTFNELRGKLLSLRDRGWPEPFGLDFETFGPEFVAKGKSKPDFTRHRLAGYSIGFLDGSRYYVPLRHPETHDGRQNHGNLDPWAWENLVNYHPCRPRWKLITGLLGVPWTPAGGGPTFWAHNLKTELAVCINEGIVVRCRAWCSEMAAYAAGMEHEAGALGLKPLARYYLQHEGPDFAEVARGRQSNEIPAADIAPYAADDAYLTLAIGQLALDRCTELDSLQHLELEQRCVPVTEHMERTGVPIDRARLLADAERCEREADALAARFEALTSTEVEVQVKVRRPKPCVACEGLGTVESDVVSGQLLPCPGTGRKACKGGIAHHKNGKVVEHTVEVPGLATKGARVGSDADVSRWLFKELQWWPVRKDHPVVEYGHSVKEEYIRRFAALPGIPGEACRIRLRHQALRKYSSTYTRSLVALADQAGDGRLHTSYKQDGTDTSRYSSSMPNQCYSGDTEVLTPGGWVRFDELAEGVEVASWEDGRVVFTKPTAYHRGHGELVQLTNEHLDLKVTPNHRCLTQRRSGRFVEVQAAFWEQDRKHFGAGVGGGNLHVREHMLRLAVAAQADGHFVEGSHAVDFSFTKERKYRRLVWLLGEAGATFSDYSNERRYRVVLRGRLCSAVRELLGASKTFGPWTAQLDAEGQAVLCDEAQHWDATVIGQSYTYYSKQRCNAEAVQTAAVLSGHRATMTERPYSYDPSRTLWHVAVHRQAYGWTTNAHPQTAGRGDFFCVTVPSTWLLVRRNGKVSVSGNSNLPRSERQQLPWMNDLPDIRASFLPPVGWVCVIFDFSQLEMRIMAHYSRDPALMECYAGSSPVDVHERTRLGMEARSSAGMKVQRGDAKITNFSTIYAISAGSLANKLSMGTNDWTSYTKGVAQSFIDGFFDTYPGVKRYHERAVDYAKEHKYATSLTGFKRPITAWNERKRDDETGRSYSLYGYCCRQAINTPIQASAGGILKRSLVGLYELWESNGMLNESVVIQGQVYDEVIVACRPDVLETVQSDMQRIMSGSAPELRVPIVAEGGSGESWSAAK